MERNTLLNATKHAGKAEAGAVMGKILGEFPELRSRAPEVAKALEVDGVLKSWAIPKGPSTNPQDKRLAVPTEDHPLEYAGFEGVIPEGYGAGTVLVWDTGPFQNLTEKQGVAIPLAEAVAHGHVKVRLEGRKLKGGYALTRFKTGKDEAWLLVKADDEAAEPATDVLKTRPESVLSGRTLEEIA